MSSMIPREDRIQREPRKVLADFTDQEQAILNRLKDEYGELTVFGSRVRGNFADDSDLDVGIEGYRGNYHRPLFERLGAFHGIKIDGMKSLYARTHDHIVI